MTLLPNDVIRRARLIVAVFYIEIMKNGYFGMNCPGFHSSAIRLCCHLNWLVNIIICLVNHVARFQPVKNIDSSLLLVLVVGSQILNYLHLTEFIPN